MPGKSEGHRAERSSNAGQHGGPKADRGEGSGRSPRANQGAGSDERSDYSQKVHERKLAEGSKKGGCFPKLFMLLLPFAAVGTYLLLRS